VGTIRTCPDLADAAPLADEAPCAEQVRLHVEPVVAVQIFHRVAAGEGERGNLSA
jgi:hypothetical protein